MAVAECILQQQFGEDVVNHYTYCLHGDGDIQEPVAQGAIAIAGHWGLNKLIHYYDANNAQISGKVTRSDSTDYRKLYEAHGWHVQEIDGHDHDAIRDAIRQAQMEIEKPSVIIGHTIMAQGCATMEDDHNTHGAPLPPEEIASTKEILELDPALFFNLPEEVLIEFRSGFTYARSEVEAWKSALSSRLEDESFSKNWNLAFGDDFLQVPIPQYEAGTKVATRKVWGPFIEKLAELHPTITGGSADLEPSNVTTGFANLVGDFNKENRRGRNFAYGVREFPMGAVNNGIALHGGLEVFGATFFVFSDYERPAIRLRALQGLPVVSEYTHDSIFVGEDGPTHQPVEHLMACRTIPNLLVLRPADANEAIVACQLAFEQKNRPALVLLTRQGIPVFDRNIYPSPEELKKGGYIMQDCEGNPEVVIFATGSEVWVALEAASKLSVKWKVRVVNIPCWELFDEQPEDYRISVLGPDSALKVSLEAGITLGWEHYTGIGGLNIGIDSFGESAPGGEVARHFGLTAESVVNKIQKHINS
jgi:transketolase